MYQAWFLRIARPMDAVIVDCIVESLEENRPASTESIVSRSKECFKRGYVIEIAGKMYQVIRRKFSIHALSILASEEEKKNRDEARVLSD
ncbi:hypothetical protein ARMSODRAFT_605246 [Armillaria solidipes]|uniref:Uncharacterized protein n=1 Tax=Armillaria solidipes TaxID=1076256 RepID=A0A2H3BF27_9AGAR|nr:hypothetical protein ARMSODRAFT_605246 [Armillaria solidipes]